MDNGSLLILRNQTQPEEMVNGTFEKECLSLIAINKMNNINKPGVKSIFAIILFLFLKTTYLAQNNSVIDKQILSPGKFVQLIASTSANEDKKYALRFINALTKDTLINYLDSLRHAPCSPLNSIFFVNDSTGFFTESGGCYACYDWLFRTTNRGLTWQYIESGSRTSGNAETFRLNNLSFYMFNELQGIIVWELNHGTLEYSVTNNGGINWTKHRASLLDKEDKKQIQDISFSADGQITIVCSEKYMLESQRQRVNILQSNNFGKSFIKLK